LAAINGRAEACTYFIEQGADVDAVGRTLFATPLQWAARNGLVYIIDLLLQQGANPRILDVQGYSCLHSVTHSSNYWALLYVLCQPETEIDERDSMGHTALHWAVYQRDEVSTNILLKQGADPNVAGDDGLTPLHWAVYSGNKKCITKLLEADADIRAKNGNLRTAQEMAFEFRNSETWNVVLRELGFKADGSRVRRPLGEVCRHPGSLYAGSSLKKADIPINVIVFTVPTASLFITFMIASVFPWYNGIILSPGVFYVLRKVCNPYLFRGSRRPTHP